jgi:antigen flippase
VDSSSTNSYRRIFKTTALIGGTSAITMLFRILQTKVLAVLLGPAGMGLAGSFISAISLVSVVTGFGIGGSAVRQIAQANATGDLTRIARTISTLRRVSLFTGFLGMGIVLCFSKPLSAITFGTFDNTTGMAMVSLCLLFGGIATGQTALLQGLRRLRDLASCQILGAAFGAAASITIIYFLRQEGIALSIVVASGFACLLSWWFARRVAIPPVRSTLGETLTEARGFLGLGIAFACAAGLAQGMDYFSRSWLAHRMDLHAVGLYQATWTLSSYYAGFVFSAMGADFFPRLTAVINDHATANRLINEQTEMGMLIALPGILITMTFSTWILQLFYSSSFQPAAEIIRWQVLGVLLRVAVWPVGTILTAKGKVKLFLGTELAFYGLSVPSFMLCTNLWGINGVGISFAAMYLVYTVAMYTLCHRITGIKCSARCAAVLALAVGAAVTTFAVTRQPGAAGTIAGAIITLAAAGFCLWSLQRRLGYNLFALLKTKLSGSRLA